MRKYRAGRRRAEILWPRLRLPCASGGTSYAATLRIGWTGTMLEYGIASGHARGSSSAETVPADAILHGADQVVPLVETPQPGRDRPQFGHVRAETVVPAQGPAQPRRVDAADVIARAGQP